MMNKEKGTFEPLPSEFTKQLDAVMVPVQGAKELEQMRKQREHILARAPKPTLYIGEIVEIKGHKFSVIRIKADGKLGLKMVPDS